MDYSFKHLKRSGSTRINISQKKNSYGSTRDVSSVLRVYGQFTSKKRMKSVKDFKDKEKNDDSSSKKILMKAKQSEEKVNKEEKQIKTDQNNKIIERHILKARSDLLDLKRDLATYEFNFLCELEDRNILQNMQVLNSKVAKSCKNAFGEDKSSLLENIKSALSEKPIEKTIPQRFIFTENKKSTFKTQQKEEVFKGSIMLSGVPCIISVRSLEDVHKFECILPDNKTLKLQLEKSLPKCNTRSEHILNIREKFLNCLYLDDYSNELTLNYSENCLKSFATFYIQLKGQTSTIVRVTDSSENFLIESKASIIVTKSSTGITSLSKENLKPLRKFMKNNLFLQNDSLYLGTEPFANKEQNSKLLNEHYLSSLFDENTTRKFSLKYSHKSKSYKFELFETSPELYLKISSGSSSIVIKESSFEFYLLLSLQCMNYQSDHVTLSNSLELGLLVDILFY